jgi:hypothetical protein
LKNGALVLFHDSNNHEVRAAIDSWIKKWFYKDVGVCDYLDFDNAYGRWYGFRSVCWEKTHLVF